MANTIITVDQPQPGQPGRRVYIIRGGELLPIRMAHSERQVDDIAREAGVEPGAVAWVADRDTTIIVVQTTIAVY